MKRVLSSQDNIRRTINEDFLEKALTGFIPFHYIQFINNIPKIGD